MCRAAARNRSSVLEPVLSSTDFYLDWKEIRPANTEFLSLSPEEMAKAGLLVEVAEQFRFVWDIYRLAKSCGDLNSERCFSGLKHLIRLGLKESARTESEIIEQED